MICGMGFSEVCVINTVYSKKYRKKQTGWACAQV